MKINVCVVAVIVALSACATEPTVSTVDQSICTAQDQADGLCISLWQARQESLTWVTDHQHDAVNLSATCGTGGTPSRPTYWCDVHFSLFGRDMVAGCILWEDGSISCDVSEDED